MEKKIYLRDLYNYDSMPENEKELVRNAPYFDLSALSSEDMISEITDFIKYRCSKIAVNTAFSERKFIVKICTFFSKYGSTSKSIHDKEEEEWKKLFQKWMFQEGYRSTFVRKKYYDGSYYCKTPLQSCFDMLMRYMEEDTQSETEKDVWELEKLDILYRGDPIRKINKISFEKISQKGIREEVKKGIYQNLQTEALNCILRELYVIRNLSQFLAEKHPSLQSCKDINREIMEEYFIYLKTEKGENRSLHSQLNRLRKILEIIGQIYDYANLLNLFLTWDIPQTPRAEFRVYTDAELKRLNAAIVKMDEQTARIMVIHQMLGTRISDTLMLEPDCLSKRNGEIIIRINQVKNRMYEKAISEELAVLIEKAIDYTKEHYGDTPYIFVNDKEPTRPLSYGLLSRRITKMIHRENLRDDHGELFGFNTHMFRHCYGVKLTEMHLDDWTIARLLGHTSIRNVKYYRRMSNQLLAEETRKARMRLSEIILNNLDGWEEEYEQIRQDDSLK